MASTNFTTHYEIPLPLGTDLTTPMDYNTAAEAVDTALFGAVTDAGNAATAAAEAVNTAEAAAGAAGDVAADLVLEKAKIVALQTRMTNAENEIDDVRSDDQDSICAYNEPTATSTHHYNVGDHLFYNDTLYIATAEINIGDTITPNTNCDTTTITAELLEIKNDLETLHDNIAGTAVLLADINSNPYPYGSPYTCPSDGYLEILARDASNVAAAYLYDANNVLINEITVIARASSEQVSSALFVRKGMKVSGLVTGTHSSTKATFTPLV